MTAEEGARALYDAGRLFQLEELARTLELHKWLRLLRAHRRCAAAERSMAAFREERLNMDRSEGAEHPAEIEEQAAYLHLLCCLWQVGVMTPGKGFRGILQMEMYQAARYHHALATACPEYLL